MYSYWKKNQLKLSPWIFLAPGILVFFLYVIFPIFQSVSLSFYEWDGLGLKTYIGSSNYVELFDDEAFYTSLKNNVIWLQFFPIFVMFNYIYISIMKYIFKTHAIEIVNNKTFKISQ